MKVKTVEYIYDWDNDKLVLGIAILISVITTICIALYINAHTFIEKIITCLVCAIWFLILTEGGNKIRKQTTKQYTYLNKNDYLNLIKNVEPVDVNLLKSEKECDEK